MSESSLTPTVTLFVCVCVCVMFVSGATFNMPCKVCYSYSFFIGVYTRAPLCDICELVRCNVALLVMLGVAQRKREERGEE